MAVNYWVEHATKQILGTYDHRVVVKPKTLLKFGAHPNLDVADGFATVWLHGPDQPNEAYVTSNIIDTVSSSNVGDTQSIKIEGHYEDANGDWQFHIQTATLNGQNKVTLAQPLIRATRLYNDSDTEFNGDVYGYEDTTISGGVPTDVSKIHIKAATDSNQSEKAATAFSSVDYGLITAVYLSVGKQSAADIDFQLQVREYDKVFRTRFSCASDNDAGLTVIALEPYIVVPPKADVRLRAAASANNTTVYAGFNSLIAIRREYA